MGRSTGDVGGHRGVGNMVKLRSALPKKPMPTAKPISFDASAPRSVTDIYHRHYQEHRDAGKSDAESHAHGARMIRHAGWYRGARGWKQLTPDLRRKVNVREAIKQPNGRYVIEGVDVFYPNAIKDKSLSFNKDDVRELVENTNRAIANGGQKPCLIEGHTSDEQKMLGIQLDSHGCGVNWRESPRGQGWARCDFVDVDEETVRRLKDLRLPGLSVRITKDPTGLNRRFGHIALLGGSMQALSHLPITEIYSTQDQLCFSADSEAFFPTKGFPMFGANLKGCHSAYASAYAAYEAAEESQKTGEPGSVEKLRDAGNKLAAALKSLSGECSEGDYEAGEGDAPLAVAPPPPAAAGASPAYASLEGIDFESDPSAAFATVVGAVKASRAENAKLVASLKSVTRLAEGLSGKLLRTEFSSEVEKLERDGHVLPGKDEIEAEFSAVVESTDPRSSMNRTLKMLRSLPKKPSPAAAGQIFTADTAGATGIDYSSDAEVDASLKRVASILGSTSLTEHDAALGRGVVK